MNDELAVLAQAGAAALVTAMATDMWLETRDTVVGLFRRADRDGGHDHGAGLEGRLDGNAALVQDSATPDDVRRALFGYWTLELAALLRRDPSCGEPLARLASGVDATLLNGLRANASGQTNTARDSGTVFAVQYGTQHADRRR
ncbi:hypothetical protein [Streptomyces sp. NBC_01235]|uniref:hypothetical protein n=1 Tax=Streptomyces sp. NBC_01235 TaxID=2903788 RepID=UPI002E12CBC9|nr:hypothetical protein OG289_18305 [Streptomyces sp. NBC_01235]